VDVLEKISETKAKILARQRLLGEGKLIDSVLQRMELRRPRVVEKFVQFSKAWKPGEKIFGKR